MPAWCPAHLRLCPTTAILGGWGSVAPTLDSDRYRKKFGLATSLASQSIILRALGHEDNDLGRAFHRDKGLGSKPLAHTTGDKEGHFQTLSRESHVVRR